MEITHLDDNVIFNSYNEGKYNIELSPKSNSIKFTIVSDGFVYGYVVGDFNNWKKLDEYRLNWKIDLNDGQAKLINEITFNERLKDGAYRFGFILVDCNGNESYVNKWSNNDGNFTFNWINYISKLKVLSSKNTVSPYSPVEVIGAVKKLYGEISFRDIKLELDTKIPGVTMTSGILKVDETVEEGIKIVIKASYDKEDLVSYKEITVDRNDKALVHYYRSDGKYSDAEFMWNIWNFDDYGNGSEIDFNMDTDIGKAAYVSYDKVIIRKKIWGYGWCNDWSEQGVTENIGVDVKNLYIIGEENACFTSMKDAIYYIKPRIKGAVLNEAWRIRAKLTDKPLLGNKFKLYINKKDIKSVNILLKEEEQELVITNIPKDIKANDLVEIKSKNMYVPAIVSMGNTLDKYYYGKNDLGITYNKSRIFLKVWAPTACKGELCIYDNYLLEKEKPTKVYPMEYDFKTGVYSTDISKKNENKFYLYKFYFNYINKLGSLAQRVTYAVDPYAVAVSVNGNMAAFVDLNNKKCKPYGWNSNKISYLPPVEDSILYELHIRDFTIDKSSGVREKLKGKYLGAVEEGTHYTDKSTGVTVKTGIDHLNELGITHVHLMPVFDFGSVDESNNDGKNRNWGYDPKNFNVPEGSYSTDPYIPYVRIREFREMVSKFHKKGLRVVMDMVYNHMMDATNMNNIVPDYYFRTDDKGRYTNGSGCGNEIATEKPMVRKFIVDSCMHWIKDYDIDGFRFDLMELIDIKTMKDITNKANSIKENFIVYGEPWTGGLSSVRYGTYKGRQRNEGFSVFNDTYRNAIRGENNPTKGFVNGEANNPSKAWSIIEGIKGSIYTLTSRPRESINYVDAHDNYTLWDQILKSQDYNVTDYRNFIGEKPLENVYVKEALLAITIIMISQGIPFIQEGSEFLRTKYGDHNSYKSDDEINGIHWDDKVRFLDIFNYYKGIIEIRKNFSSLRMKNEDDIRKNLNIYFANGDEKSGVIIVNYKNYDIDDFYKELIIVINASNCNDYDVNSILPIGDGTAWNVISSNYKAAMEPEFTVYKWQVPKVNAHSVLILYK